MKYIRNVLVSLNCPISRNQPTGIITNRLLTSQSSKRPLTGPLVQPKQYKQFSWPSGPARWHPVKHRDIWLAFWSSSNNINNCGLRAATKWYSQPSDPAKWSSRIFHLMVVAVSQVDALPGRIIFPGWGPASNKKKKKKATRTKVAKIFFS